MDYFKQKQLIAQVDKDDTILDPIDKWKAHKQGILHRAFTIAILFEDKVLLQHRKHPVFDNVYDITISSHQLFVNKELESDTEAIFQTLQREWFISKNDLLNEPEYKGNIYYKAKDPNSDYIEHEICHIYSCNIKKLIEPNLDFAYGYSVERIEDVKKPTHSFYNQLAPWVTKTFEEGLL